MSGKLVVAPSRTAPSAPIAALAVTSANVASPASESDSGPTSTAGPPRTNGTKAATKTTSGRITRTRDQTIPGSTARERRDRRQRDEAGHERRPGVQRRRHADDRDPREPEDLRPRIEAMDRARGIAGHARAVEEASAHAVAVRRRVATTRP